MQVHHVGGPTRELRINVVWMGDESHVKDIFCGRIPFVVAHCTSKSDGDICETRGWMLDLAQDMACHMDEHELHLAEFSESWWVFQT